MTLAHSKLKCDRRIWGFDTTSGPKGSELKQQFQLFHLLPWLWIGASMVVHAVLS